MKQIKFLFLAVLTLAMGFSSCSDDDDKEVTKSAAKAITQFKVGEITGSINEADKTITLGFPFGTDVTKLKPEVTISEKATVSPKSGDEVNLTEALPYTVTAEDGTTVKYTVTATVALSSEAKITSFDIGEGDSKVVGTIDEDKKAISVVVPFGTDVTKLVPTVGIAGSEVDPKSGVEKDFTNPQPYTVTANDGTTVKYTVTVFVGEFATAITKVDKETVVIGESIVLTGTFAKENNTVELVKGETTLKLTVTAQNETSITAAVSKEVTEFGDYTLGVTSNGVKATYETKIAVVDIVAPIVEEYSTSPNVNAFFVGNIMKLTGKNMAEVTAVRLFRFDSAEDAWTPLGGDITPEAVTATSTEFIIPEFAADRVVKLILITPDRASELPPVAVSIIGLATPWITSLKEDKVMEGTWITINGRNLKPDETSNSVVHFKIDGRESYTATYGNVNAEGTEVKALLPNNIQKGKQSVYVAVNDRMPNQKKTNLFDNLEVIENTLPAPEITSISPLTPEEDEIITITGKNFTNIDDTRIQIYELVNGEWVKEEFGFVLKPREVTATSVSFALNYRFAGKPTKVTVLANGKESKLPGDENIITVR